MTPTIICYQWESSRDYNASPGLERIEATLLAINSADDERNPPELGVLDREIKRVKNGRVLLIPGSDQTAGPRHHRPGAILEAAARRAAANPHRAKGSSRKEQRQWMKPRRFCEAGP